MAEDPRQAHGGLSRNALVVAMLLAGGLTLGHLCGSSAAWLAAQLTVFTEGARAGAVLLAAGGYGYLVVRLVAPAQSPSGLRVVTACGLGLWMLATAVLAVGSAGRGLLIPAVWWPVVAGGVALAMWQGRRRFNDWKPLQRTDSRGLLWVIVAVAVGFWLAGATMPPGYIGLEDSYDVLEYHLQVPREFFQNQHIGALRHNCYSFYPMGVEMLYLLAMCLHGGAYEAVYLAKLLHGLLAALAVAGIFLSLRRDSQAQARFSAGALATVPLVLYLSWLAMAELGQVLYLAMAVLWLRQWLADRSVRSALCIGAMLGAGCATKYLAVGFLVAPVLLVMLPACLRRFRLLGHLAAAGLLCLALFSPWLIRNAVYTGNPVFPLGTGILGGGYWSAQEQQRWADGHGPRINPPVPPPPDYQSPSALTRIEMFYRHFLTDQLFGQVLLVVAGLSICLLFAETPRPDAWSFSLAGVLAVQLAVWSAFTHGMPPRFLVPAVVPICLLAGRALARLAAVKVSPFRRWTAPPAAGSGPWGLAPAVAVFVLGVVGVNLLTAYNLYGVVGKPAAPLHGAPVAELARTAWLGQKYPQMSFPRDSRFLLVGDAEAFYFPPDTLYATAFDSNPLAEMIRSGLSGPRLLQRLKELGVTHVWVHWYEMWRLAWTYGYSPVLTEEMFQRWQRKDRPGLAALDELTPLGVRSQDLPEPTFRPGVPWQKSPRELTWPAITLYTMPWVPPATTAPATGASATATSTSPATDRTNR